MNVRRTIALLLGGFLVAAAAGAIAALSASRRIVPVDDPEADEVHLLAAFGPLAFRSRSARFRGGTIDCWYGGAVIDLRDAVLDPAGAVLRVRAIFGGGQIVVPEGWRVTSRVVGIGGVGDGRARLERPEVPRLEIEGIALFGGFGISSDIPEGQLEDLEEAVRRRGGGEARAAADAAPGI